MGKLCQAPRWTQAYGVSYSFTGQTAEARALDDAGTPPLVRDELCAWDTRLRRAGALPGRAALNGALLNWYDGALKHYIGPHSDDERTLAAGAPIVSLSFGQRRRFRFTCKRKTGECGGGGGGGGGGGQDGGGDRHERELVLELADGDAVVMGGDCQRTHKHEIMKLRKSDPGERRVNLTMRAFTTATAATAATAAAVAGGE